MENCPICNRPLIDEEGHNPLCAQVVALDIRVTALEQAKGKNDPEIEIEIDPE
jgi:hypothetical protein